MLINEVVTLTGLTKKAICYYEENGLINLKKGFNGYREYSEKEIAILNEISLYRKLDISIRDIKLIINNQNKKDILNKILEEKHKKEIQIKMQKTFLDRVINNDLNGEDIKELNEEIIKVEKSEGQFIKRELMRAFPSGFGKYLAYHFAPYLNEPLDTLDKYDAWIKIIEFLDNVPEIKIPRIIEMGYENTTDDMHKRINDNVKDEMNKMFNATAEELEEYKKKLLDRIEKQNDKSLLKVMSPFRKFKKQLTEFFSSSGYYGIFLPNMKIISRKYKEYHDNLMRLNDKLSKELGIKYDENMRIVIVKD